jgi:hypothetical protein
LKAVAAAIMRMHPTSARLMSLLLLPSIGAADEAAP